MTKTIAKIADLFHIPSQFMRSVQLERDFNDPQALENYIVTPSVAESFRRLADGSRAASTRRAWRITGDYGVGKSSFALVTAHLLAEQGHAAARIGAEIGWAPAESQKPLWPVLITGAREDLAKALARGFVTALRSRRPTRGKAPASLEALISRAEVLSADSDPAAFEAFLLEVRAEIAKGGRGVLLIVDELGKLLEHAAGNVGREDVFLLQRIAELATRSGDVPFFFIGLLHQGFQAYADTLPPAVKHEWDKVAGRFEEIVFDQPLAHTAALVGGALGCDTEKLGKDIQAAARTAAKATAGMGWLAGATTSAKTLDAAPLYPLHPTVLPLLVRFFARYGQHERSLFGFLLSSEPFGLQAFSNRSPGAAVWYGLDEFYDYVRSNFGHRLNGYQNHWLRISATVDTALELEPLEWRVLKAIAILNLLDAEDLLPSDAALRACFAPTTPATIDGALRGLSARGLLFRRGAKGGYRLWPNSSVNLHTALEQAERALGPIQSVSAYLETTLEAPPVLARRHYVTRGTMRFFEVRYAQASTLAKVAARPTSADGMVIIGLGDGPEDQAQLLSEARGTSFAARDDLVIGILKPLGALSSCVHDLRCWQWVAANTPELGHDVYAAAEVSRQISRANRVLSDGLSVLSGLRQKEQPDVAWFYEGSEWSPPGGLSRGLSNLCDRLFDRAPKIANELLNRNVLSSPASAARMRLIEGLFDAGDKPYFGIDAVKAPPEKSMYLSVIQRGRIHYEEEGGLKLVLPESADDPLNMAPALEAILDLLDAGDGERIAVPSILAMLKARPYGIRDGLAPLFLALIVKARGHEIAVYENGTFRAAFSGHDFMRLIKAPGTFELQKYRIAGVRAEVFARLAAIFAAPTGPRAAELLDVVGALSRFAASLPEYTRKAGALTRISAAVRDVLMSAREPAPMLFQELPRACGLEPFTLGEPIDEPRIGAFIESLEASIAELRSAYPKLLQRLMTAVGDTTGYSDRTFDRVHLSQRAARVSLAARAPRLKAFAARLRDPGIDNDKWAEALVSFVMEKPPNRWSALDEANCIDDLAELGELFFKAEVAAFHKDQIHSDKTAVRVNLTRGDGVDLSQIVHGDPLDPAHAAELVVLSDHLPQGWELRMQFLMQLLWNELEASPGRQKNKKGSRETSESSVG
jgi:hypothetical protein